MIDERRFPGRQGRLLFAYLVAEEGRAVPRGELAETLWGGDPPSTWEKALSVLVSKLRVLLGESGIAGASALTGAFGCYRLELPEGSWVDVLAAAGAASAAEEAFAAGETGQAKTAAALAESLLREPFLPGDEGSWVEEKRRELTQVRARALTVLADASLRSGEGREAAQWAEQVIALEPFRESGYRRLMEAHVAAGDRAEALRTYDRCRRLLAEELGAYPSPETESIFRTLLEAPPPPSGTRRSQVPPPDPKDHGRPAPATGAGIAGPGHRPRGRGALLALAAGGAVLLAAIAAAIVALPGRGTAGVRAAANTVAIIDASTDRVTSTIAVGARPGAIAFGAGSVWVANLDDQSVSRIDPNSLRTLRTIALPGAPMSLAASSDGVWVVESNGIQTSGVSVSRIDTEFDSPGATVQVGNVVPNGPGAIAAQGRSVWVAPSNGLLTSLDPSTGRPQQQLDPNASPSGVAIGEGALWLTDSEANNVIRVDPTGLVKPIPVGNGPTAIAAGDGGVWVVDSLDEALVRVDPETWSVTATIPVGRSPAGVAVGGGAVWVANSGDGTVTRINPITDKATTISVGGSPQALTVASGRVWVTVDERSIAPSDAGSGGGTLRIVSFSDVDSMDPAVAYGALSLQLVYATCVQLVNYPDVAGPAGSQLTPEAAQTLPMRSDEGKTYTFTVRRGFRFSPPSNQPVTAQTFKDSIERTLNPKMNSPFAPDMMDIVGARAYMAGTASDITGIVARRNKLTIRLTAPSGDFLSRIALSGFCAVPSNTPIKPNVRPIPSAGPYYVTSYAPGHGVVLAQNPSYHGSRPHHFTRIELALGIPARRAVDEIEADTADYTTLGPWSYPSTTTISGLVRQLAARYGTASGSAARQQQYFVNPTLELDYLALNTHRPLFRDVRLRRAVNFAIDRRALAAIASDYGPEPTTDHYLPPGMPGYRSAPVYPTSPDLAKARQLVQSAHARGRTAVLYTLDYPPGPVVAQIVKNNLGAIGIQAQIKTFSTAALYMRLSRPGEPFDLAYAVWIADHPDPSQMLNLLLDGTAGIPSFNDPASQRRLAAAAQLSGPQRYLTYGELDLDLARNAAPLAAFGNNSSYDFFSTRIGCQTFGIYGMDLAALCTRSATRR